MTPPAIVLTVMLVVYAVLETAKTPKKPRKDAQRIVADAGGITVDGAALMNRADIVNAYADELPDDDGRYGVHLHGRFLRRRCAIFVDSHEKAAALVAALQREPKASVAHFRALPPWAKHLRWLVVLLTASPWVLINVIRLVPAWGIGAIIALYAVILVPTLLPQTVDVGEDGVFLRWLGNKRFIPFSAIEIVSGTKLGVDLFLRGEASVEILLTNKAGAADTQVKAMIARIKEGIAAHAGLSRADEEAFLARSGRDLETWMKEMRALGAGEMSGYRAAAIPRERLWAVVENPAADPSAREGAALALSATLEEGDSIAPRIARSEDRAATPPRRARRREPRRRRVAPARRPRDRRERSATSLCRARSPSRSDDSSR